MKSYGSFKAFAGGAPISGASLPGTIPSPVADVITQ